MAVIFLSHHVHSLSFRLPPFPLLALICVFLISKEEKALKARRHTKQTGAPYAW